MAMANRRGLTLLELILAISMIGIVLLTTHSLYFSSAQSSLVSDQTVKIQDEINFVFHDLELYLSDGVYKGVLSQVPPASGVVLPAKREGPLFLRGSSGSSVWLGILNGINQEVWYGFVWDPGTHLGTLTRYVYSPAGVPNVCATPSGNWCASVVSAGFLMPYAIVDADHNWTVTAGETTAQQNCLASLAKAVCEDASVYPVFQTDGKTIYISLAAKGNTVGKQVTELKGLTKTIVLHAVAD